MTVVLYCQHVLGLGHFMRSLAIARALSPHRVVFVTGGRAVDLPLPGNVVLEPLEALAMDENFQELRTVAGGDLAEVKARRAARLMAVLERERPDIFLVELYPFGRRAFEFELLPALEAARQGHFGKTRTVCSLRDILVEKADPAKYQARVIQRLNTFFDALLVHSDPGFFPLEETFPAVSAITVPLVYTGFVAERPAPGAGDHLRRELGLGPADKLIVASAGGGNVGGELLFAAVQAFALLPPDFQGKMRIFSGPFLDDQAYERLVVDAYVRPEIAVERFSPDFLDFLSAADVSLSLGGYNTVMNILAANVPALVWPFAQNREQAMRAERLASAGAITRLGAKDLQPERMAGLLGELLAGHRRTAPCPVRLDGSEETARYLSSLIN
jgi:predicted glycosyltransferase